MNLKFGDYNPAMKNLKNGFGLSEYQSAHTLQKSSVSSSFPKNQRFNFSVQEKSPSSQIVLPSTFGNKNNLKGTCFGYGKRGILYISSNPGPGTYELSSLSKMGRERGYIFGESRQNCKNALNTMKTPKNRSQRRSQNMSKEKNRDFTSGLKLPNIETYENKRNVSNYHFIRQNHTQSILK